MQTIHCPLRRIALVSVLLSASAAFGGGVSDGGGGMVIYQAEAIKAIMRNMDVLTQFRGQGKAFIKSLNFVSAAHGVSRYELWTEGSCVLQVTATADETGYKYHVEAGQMICPKNGADRE